MNKISVGGLIPIDHLHPIARKKILDVLNKYSFEEQLYALLLWHMIKQLDESTQKLKYVQRNLRHLARINMATRYVKSIIDATNRVWLESFEEMCIDVNIAGFCKSIVFKKEKMFKKMGIRLDDFIKLDTLHGAKNYTMATLKVINLMFQKADIENTKHDEACSIYHNGLDKEV